MSEDDLVTSVFWERSKRDKRTRVKICGLTNIEDAVAAIEAGADALGFNFYHGSSRYIAPDRARDWLTELPNDVVKIAVMVDPSMDEAIGIASFSVINALQLHGDESPQFCRAIVERGVRLIKAVGVRDETSLRALPAYSTDAILLDSRGSGFGGTGETFPWHLAKAFVDERPDLQVIIAGGLTPENVAKAVRALRPCAVDVTSGVEVFPGRKDLGRLKDFIEAVRDASE